MFSYKYCEIFKNTYFEEHLWAAASDINYVKKKEKLIWFKKSLQNTLITVLSEFTDEVRHETDVVQKTKCLTMCCFTE